MLTQKWHGGLAKRTKSAAFPEASCSSPNIHSNPRNRRSVSRIPLDYSPCPTKNPAIAGFLYCPLQCFNGWMARSARFLYRMLAVTALVWATHQAHAATPSAALPAHDANAALHARYLELQPRLRKNDFGRPVYLDSREEGRNLRGDVYAVIDHPFKLVDGSLPSASNWCDILILPYNTKHCTSQRDRSLSLYVGKKKDTPLEDAFRIDFNYQLVARERDYLRVVLAAGEGPLGTKDYRILLEAVPLDDSHTFLHLSYSYSYGMVSNLAMQTYLATTGADKVGFSVEGLDGGGKPHFVKGMRGVLERNTMRYFLAIDAFLDSLAVPVAAQVEKRVNDWFSASERFPRQLHEMGRGEYVAMKQRETQRLQAAKVAGR